MGKLDIAQYYPSVRADLVAAALHRTGAPVGAIRLIRDFLREMVEVESPAGLPIGMDSSGVIGNLLLAPTDIALAPIALGLVRWTDDTWVFVADRSQWSSVISTYAAVTEPLQLRMNTEKSILLDDEDQARAAIRDSRIDYLTDGLESFMSEEQAFNGLVEQVASDEPDWKAVRFSLGALRSQASPLALPVLEQHSYILDQEPLAAGRYLLQLAKKETTRRRLDRDWVTELATTGPDESTAVRQIQLCRVARELRPSRTHGRRFRDLAEAPPRRSVAPLQAWAASAWGASADHNSGEAVAMADHVGDFTLRRACALTIDRSSLERSRRNSVATKLRRIDPDLEPTLSFLGL